MTVELNHIIIPARDRHESAQFLAGILGLPVGQPFGPFVPVTVGNGVTLDFADRTEFHSQHCAFLVGDAEFDAAFARIRERGVTFYADPQHTRPGELNHYNGGRGFYFDDPSGHNMELLTRS
ncbi:MAG TPA: VOC family protein [Candidatus Dormibacteraeota bacterium]|jgi:catechol 2,3-dioxygenase-like lactoylglutathione lyase family enzyme|nr:VOC family protein [Candidatus Dormibacteraeota bacterium]